jgi:hypothetical protein
MYFSSFLLHSEVKSGNAVNITSVVRVWLSKTGLGQVNLVSLSYEMATL